MIGGSQNPICLGFLPSRPSPPKGHQRDREDQIELLFHRQRPCVQERFFLISPTEIVCGSPKIEIRDQQRLRDHRGAELCQILRQKQKPACKACHCHHQCQGRKNPPNAALPEIRHGKRAPFQIFENQRSNQIPRDHEKHIHSHISAWESQPCMIENHT